MIQRLRATLIKLQELFCAAQAKRSDEARRNDHNWMIWGIVNVLNLSIIVLIMAMGIFYEAEYLIIEQLGSFPFYITAEEAKVSSLSQNNLFILCVLISLYFSALLLSEKRGKFRALLVLLILLSLILSIFLGLIWGGILNMAAPICGVLLLWIICELVHFTRAYLQPESSHS